MAQKTGTQLLSQMSVVLAILLCLFNMPVWAQVTQMDTTKIPVPRSEAFFGIHFDLHANAGDKVLGRDATPANIDAFLDRVKPDFVQYDCKGHPGYTGYPTEVGYASPGIVKDALRLWRDETRERGIGLYVHYSGVIDGAAVQHHPEWACINADGKPASDTTSLFGGYAENLMIPQLKEVTSKYDLDGVWVDGDCWGARLDYGTTAVQKWKEISGYNDIPRKRDDPHWQEWKTFHRNAFEDYLVNWVDALHESDPSLQVTSNWSYTPHMPLPVKAGVDFLSGDFSAKKSVDRARFEARYLASTGMPWDLMAWGFNGYEGNNGVAHQMKTATQLEQEAAVVMGLGGGVQVYYQPTRSGFVSRAITETAGKVADFCRARQVLAHKSKTIPQVALLLSSASYFDRMDSVFSPGGQYNALEGALHLLLETGYSVDLMAEHQLAPQIADFPVVAIAQSPILTDEFRDQVVQYVRGGGTLVLLDLDSTRPFEKFLGVETGDKPADSVAYVGDINATAPVPGQWQKITSGSAEIIAWRTDQFGELTDGVTSSVAYGYHKSVHEPAATKSRLGKGAIYAVYGPLPQAYFNSHHPALRRWADGIFADAFPSPTARLLNAPYVDMSLRTSRDGTPTVHLANLADAQRAEQFAAMDRIPGSGSLRLQWRLTKKPKGFLMMPDNQALKFNELPGANREFRVEIAIENVPVHGMVIPKF